MLQTSTRLVSFLVFAVFSTIVAPAQSPARSEAIDIPGSSTSWQLAQLTGASKRELVVVTLDRPHRRRSCRIHSFTQEKLVCSRAIGVARTYFPQQVLALIVPGDNALRIKLLVGLNVGLGAAIWGTVVLAATCPGCAVATRVTALLLFCAGGAISYGDGQPDRLIYRAPNQELPAKLGR